MFKKKIWKRGAKLTIKELNRIEDGIESIGGTYFIPFSLDLSTGTASTHAIMADAIRAKEEGKTLQAIINLGIDGHNAYASLIEYEGYTLKFETIMLMNNVPVINRLIWNIDKDTQENLVEFASITLLTAEN